MSNKMLTLTEIMTISECYPDREHFARAVIAAYEAKLNSAKPVAWKDSVTTSDEQENITKDPALLGYDGWGLLHDGSELFKHPPAPSAVDRHFKPMEAQLVQITAERDSRKTRLDALAKVAGEAERLLWRFATG